MDMINTIMETRPK